MGDISGHSLRGWAYRNGLGANIVGILEQNGCETVQDVLAKTSGDLKEMDFNLAERNRIKAATAPHSGHAGKPVGQPLPSNLHEQLRRSFEAPGLADTGRQRSSEERTPPPIPTKHVYPSGRPLPPAPPHLSTLPLSDDGDEEEEEEKEEAEEEEEDGGGVADDAEEEEDEEEEEEVQPGTSAEDVKAKAARAGLERVLAALPCVTPGPPAVYKVPVTETARCETHSVRRCVHGKKTPYSTEKSILMIGETGSGKSTMIDAIVNHVLGVGPTDNFRFTIIDTKGEESGIMRNSSQSQTDWITCYTISVPYSRVDYTLNIVDTPGFNDTRGLDRDVKIVAQIKELFESREEYGLRTLDAVCFVMKASETRVTAAKKYVLDSVLALFGKDLTDNVFILCTFSDGSAPELLICLEEENVRYNRHFTMNNQWLSCEEDMFSKFFWEMGIKNLEAFFDVLGSIEPKSLTMSLDVLHQRKDLEENVSGLQRLLGSTAGHLQSIRSKIEALEGRPPRVKMPTGKLMKRVCKDNNYNCQKCGITCLESIGKMDQFTLKLKRKKTKCVICDCSSGNHKIQKFRFAWIRVADPTNSNLDISIKALKAEEARYNDKFEVQIQRMKVTMQNLDDIAMRPQLTSIPEYIELVIEKEEQEQKPGWQSRVEMMRERKETYALLGQYIT